MFPKPAYEDNFFEQVYAIARLIPRGRVTSYGAIARALGAARSSRMVGWAMSSVHDLKDIPAHRVVNRAGMLTGKMHFSPPSLMQEMLEKEGVKVKKDTVCDFDKIFWNPIELIKEVRIKDDKG
jgi:methylated-DNA-protein-cysteine methyltransferase-like protein